MSPLIPVVEAVPWIPHMARKWMERILQPDFKCFEWGSGGSTIWLGDRCESIVSVEHDSKWALDIHRILPRGTYLLIPPEPPELGNDKANPNHYRAGPVSGVNFKAYATSIVGRGPFDLVMVDGRARASCIMHAVPEIRPGGWLVLDNAERDYYLEQTAELLQGWESVRFYGHGPYIDWPWQCAFWRKPYE